MPVPLLIPGLLQAGSAIVSGLFGRKQRREGQKILDNSPYPTMNVPNEISRQAGEGLPSQQYAQAHRNIQRAQTNAILGAQSRRGGLGMLGKIQQGTNDATLNLDAADATAKQQNERLLASYKMKAWDWNVRNKYDQDRQYGMSLLGAGNENTVNAIDKGLSAAGMLFPGIKFGGGGSGGSRDISGRMLGAGLTPPSRTQFVTPAQKFDKIRY